MNSSGVVGLVGAPVEISSTSQFDEATITFTYDESKLGDIPEENLSIMWYDEENRKYIILDKDSVVDTENNTVSYTTTHFSSYMLVDRQQWFDAWRTTIDYKKESTSQTYYDFVFVVDRSSSMNGSSLSNAKTAMYNFIDCLSDKDNAGLVSFNTQATLVCPIGSIKEELYSGVISLYASGGTKVSQGLNMGVNQLVSHNSNNERAIVLICDGDVDNVNSIVNIAIANNIKIFTVNVMTSYHSVLNSIAERTGGEYYYAYTSEQIVDALDNIAGSTVRDIDRTDSDGDGLPDVFERMGMKMITGEVIYTDPHNPDCDGDGLLDGEEIKISSYQSWEYVLNDDGTYDFNTVVGYEFYLITDPNNSDSDGDGYSDDIDFDPLHYDKINGLLFQTDHEMGLGYDKESLANDLTSNDYTDEQLLEINSLFQEEISYDEAILEEEFRIMCRTFFSYGSNDMVNQLIDAFINGTGDAIMIETNEGEKEVACYSNKLLRQKVYEDEQVESYIEYTKNTLIELLKENKGNLIKAMRNIEDNIKQSGVSKIQFSRNNPSYLLGGLTISINDLWGSNVCITDYQCDGTKFSGTLRFTLYDHFGLDQPDVEKMYVNLAGFRAWYTLQHSTKYNGKYKPYINIMEKGIYFEGQL